MFDELDEALRQLLIREIPIKNGEVDIKFEQPKREWSARVSRPTLNLFLWDVRENIKLRQTQPAWSVEQNRDGTVTKRRKPVRLDLHYMLTAWATEPEDEHRLLSRAILALFRVPNLPDDLVTEGLQPQPVPISLMPGQYDELRNPADVWNVLDNEMRPSIPLTITLAVDPYAPVLTPLVRTVEIRTGPSSEPATKELDGRTEPSVYWTIGGTVRSRKPLNGDTIRLLLVEQGLNVPIQPEGRFSISRLRAGAYTLELSVEGQAARRYAIVVPSPDYDLEV